MCAEKGRKVWGIAQKVWGIGSKMWGILQGIYESTGLHINKLTDLRINGLILYIKF